MRQLTFDDVLQEYSHGRRDFTNIRVVMKWTIDRDESIKIDLSNADFRGSDVSNVFSLDYEWELRGINLSGVNFSGLELDYCKFIRANLREAIFQGVCLLHADLSYADLTRADLSRTDLEDANFLKADLTGASFRSAKIFRNRFMSSNLTDADFRTNIPMKDVRLYECNLTRTNFNGIQGLTYGVGSIHPINTFSATVMPDGSIRD